MVTGVLALYFPTAVGVWFKVTQDTPLSITVRLAAIFLAMFVAFTLRRLAGVVVRRVRDPELVIAATQSAIEAFAKNA